MWTNKCDYDWAATIWAIKRKCKIFYFLTNNKGKVRRRQQLTTSFSIVFTETIYPPICSSTRNLTLNPLAVSVDCCATESPPATESTLATLKCKFNFILPLKENGWGKKVNQVTLHLVLELRLLCFCFQPACFLLLLMVNIMWMFRLFPTMSSLSLFPINTPGG